jgi:hypothetical protein
LKDIEISPQIVFYAHRNIKKINSEEQAQQYLKIRSISGGAVFELTNGNLSVEKIEIDSQSH